MCHVTLLERPVSPIFGSERECLHVAGSRPSLGRRFTTETV